MRKYTDAHGHVTGTSKGCQGGCAGLLMAVFLLFVICVCIAALAHS